MGKVKLSPFPGSAVDVLLRPNDIVYDPDSPLQARTVAKTFLGAATLYRLQLATGSLLGSILPSHVDLEAGQNLGIRIAADHLVVFQVRTRADASCRANG